MANETKYLRPVPPGEKLLKDNLDEMKERIPAIIEGPFYKGVNKYEDSNVAVLLVAKCQEEDRYQVQRDLNREYRRIFQTKGIDISFTHVIVDDPEKSSFKVTTSLKKETDQFNEEQKELSKGMENQEH